MPIGLYVGLEKYSCDMCGHMGSKPEYAVVHKDGNRADICRCCYDKCLAYPKFQEGIKSGEIKVIKLG